MSLTLQQENVAVQTNEGMGSDYRFTIEEEANGRWRIIDKILREVKIFNLPKSDAIRLSQTWNSQVRGKETV